MARARWSREEKRRERTHAHTNTRTLKPAHIGGYALSNTHKCRGVFLSLLPTHTHTHAHTQQSFFQGVLTLRKGTAILKAEKFQTGRLPVLWLCVMPVCCLLDRAIPVRELTQLVPLQSPPLLLSLLLLLLLLLLLSSFSPCTTRSLAGRVRVKRNETRRVFFRFPHQGLGWWSSRLSAQFTAPQICLMHPPPPPPHAPDS